MRLLPFLSVLALLIPSPPASAAAFRAAGDPPAPRTPAAGPTERGGRPAAAPWQQGVRYRIEATLDESTDVLRGRVRIRYTNESPDTLTRFYLHQYLNAFRPNSAWARRDLEHGNRTFQDLGPEEHAYERIRRAEVGGRRVEPFYPHAPDSTIAGLRLPRPLPPGDSLTVDVRWDARLSTVPRRQGRRGRSFDFAQWYPRVVVYDLEGWRTHPLYRQGEFYGEFAAYDVTLEVADDQVLGATGVPLEGDPGWEGAKAPGTGEVDHRRDAYAGADRPPCREGPAGERVCGVFPPESAAGPGEAEGLGLLEGEPAPDRKRVRWYAEDVHHFAWSASPDYIYEQGAFEDVAIRVLYRPGDEDSWGGGTAVERTATALEWFDHVFGDYAYPQITNLHRIEGGGTEFPMVIMDGSPSLGLILHETGHVYAHGILANNEWYEGWLDEGMTSFLTSWFFEERGAGRDVWLGSEAGVLRLELQEKTWPVTYPAEDYPEYGVYGAMIYTKGSLILRTLREMAGEEAMLEILRTYYERYRFRHVDEARFQEVAEEVLREDLDWFFGQWLHATGVVDYALDGVEVEETPDGGARTTFSVERKGEMVMPVPVRLTGPDGQRKDTTVSGTDFFQEAAVETPFRPVRVELDPDGSILDWNGLNDVHAEGLFARPGVARAGLRPLGAQEVHRDRLFAGFFPLAWANDAGGVVLGLQRRTNYLGAFHHSVLRLGLPAVRALDYGELGDGTDFGSLYYRIEDPIVRDRVRTGRRAELFVGEGRVLAKASWSRDVSPFPLSRPRRTVRGFAGVATTYDTDYLITGRWGEGERTTVEAGLGATTIRDADLGTLEVDVEGAVGLTSEDERYLRGSVSLAWSRAPSGGWGRSFRIFAGAATGAGGNGDWEPGRVPVSRRFGLSGAGPWSTAGDPWSRSRGGLLAVDGHHPGEGGLRGYDRGLMASQLVTAGGELRTPRLGVGPWDAALVGFVEGGWASEIRDPDPPDPGHVLESADAAGRRTHATIENLVPADAGVGFELSWSNGPLALRVDLPVWVSEPDWARSGRHDAFAPRWSISVVEK